jgi:hypothetical protein
MTYEKRDPPPKKRTDTDKVYSDCYAKKVAELTAEWRKTNKLTDTPNNEPANTALWNSVCKDYFPTKKKYTTEELMKIVEPTQEGD